MKNTSRKSSIGTSFHGQTIEASVSDLRRILGEPVCEQNDGEDKVNFEWEMETASGKIFTVYDWKEYRRIRENETIEWHIGAERKMDSVEAAEEINSVLEFCRTNGPE